MKTEPLQAFLTNEKSSYIKGDYKCYNDIDSVRKDFGEESEVFKELAEFGARGLLETPFILILL